MEDSHLKELMHRFRTVAVDDLSFKVRKAKTPASSEVAYCASQEYFRKRKDRDSFKNAWEFLMLRIWHDVLENYAGRCDVSLSAPMPHAAEEDSVIMQYLPAPNATLLNRLKKGVRPGAPYDDLRVDAAAVFHAGALCGVKEAEDLLHRDFQVRHLLFSYTNPALYIIDVENARQGCAQTVRAENAKFKEHLRQHTNGRLGKRADGKPHTFDDLFDQGRQMVKDEEMLPDVIKAIEEEYGINIDARNYRISLR